MTGAAACGCSCSGGNRGPAFARNHAIAHSAAPLIAILDADDFFLKGRFDRLVGKDDWDFVADNIVFIDQRDADLAEPAVPDFDDQPGFLDLPGFVEGNISAARRNTRRDRLPEAGDAALVPRCARASVQ